MAIRMPAVWRVTRATASWRANSLGGGQNFGIAALLSRDAARAYAVEFPRPTNAQRPKEKPRAKAGQVLRGKSNQLSAACTSSAKSRQSLKPSSAGGSAQRSQHLTCSAVSERGRCAMIAL